ncbi:MAG: Rne/Rng family ribonuclease [Candidatus Omnitrophota bacterium]
MQRQILINAEPKETRVAIMEGNNLEDYYVERSGYKRIVGNIYKGKVDAIIPGLAAAFIDIGLERDGFLYAGDVASETIDMLLADNDEALFDSSKRKAREDIAKLLKKGQEILIQIEKEAIGMKGPRLTQFISIPGRYLVLMPLQKRHIGISKKIEGADRQRIKKMLEDLKVPPDVSLIVRTAALNASIKDLAREMKFLLKTWARIRGCAHKEKPPKLVYEEYDLILRVVRDLFNDEVSALHIDSKEEFRRIMNFLNMVLPSFKSKVKLYRGSKGLFEEFGVDKEIEKLYEKKVLLRSKGSIIIEQTESLVSIDVNSAGFVGKKNPEETAFHVNLEAAREVARQIRLRDMGGIIIIDFIDMEMRDHRHKVHRALEESLKRDKARTEVLNVSSIGVIEMTRQRMGRSLHSIAFQDCPYCKGEGSVKAISTVSIEVFRKLRKILNGARIRVVEVVVHPDVAGYLAHQDRDMVTHLESAYRCRVKVKGDPILHVEEIKIFPST